MDTGTIYTIGHSNHAWQKFADLIAAVGIDFLIDIRTHPRSRFAQFNQAALVSRLGELGIGYLHMGDPLGGRPTSSGVSEYQAIAATDAFQDALTLVERIAKTQRVVLMVPQHEPLDCHRFLLVARRLTERGAVVQHLLRDGGAEPHNRTEDRLLQATRTKVDRGASRSQALSSAHATREEVLRRKKPK